MRAASIPAEEQYRLIMECRASGLSDSQWCLEHDIKPGTFYNWVKRLRNNGCTDLPSPARCRKQDIQEVVRLEFDQPCETYSQVPDSESGVFMHENACQASPSVLELVISDQGYNNLPDVRRCCCWAHLRRYFVEAVPKGKELDYSNPAAQAVQYCNRLFEYALVLEYK